MRHLHALLPLLLMSSTYAQSGTIATPCGARVEPAFAEPGRPPSIVMLDREKLSQSRWSPPNCTGWSPTSSTILLIAVAGSFRFDGRIEDVIKRIAAISSLPTVKYWSQSDNNWRSVAITASALSSPDAQSRRPDFSPTDFTPGSRLYYWENDSRVGDMVYEMVTRERSADRLLIVGENVTPVRYFALTASGAHSIQSLTFVQHLSGNLWGVYLLERVSDDVNPFLPLPKHSLLNHVMAFYREVVGLKVEGRKPDAFETAE